MRSLSLFDVCISHPFNYLPCPYFKPLIQSLYYPKLQTVRITCPLIQAEAMNAISMLMQDATGVNELEIRGRVEDNQLLDWLYESLSRITRIKFRVNVKDDFRKLVSSTPWIQHADLRIQMLTPMLLHDISGWKELQELSLTRTMDARLLPEFTIHQFIRQVFSGSLIKLAILNKKQGLNQQEQDQLLQLEKQMNLQISLVNGRGMAERLIRSLPHPVSYHMILVSRRS